MRRRALLILTCLVVTVLIPAGRAVAGTSGGWTEGFTLSIDPAINCGLQGGGFRFADVTATKTFDGDGSVTASTFDVFLQTGGHVPTTTITSQIGPVLVDVPIDPDFLSVSTDLGWAGLDASVVLHDSISDADVPVEIHLSLFAVTGVTQQGGQFQRDARAASDVLDLPFASLFTNEFGATAPIGKVIVTTVPFGPFSFLTACPLDVTIFSTRAPS
jgi:hypothetical protein